MKAHFLVNLCISAIITGRQLGKVVCITFQNSSFQISVNLGDLKLNLFFLSGQFRFFAQIVIINYDIEMIRSGCS